MLPDFTPQDALLVVDVQNDFCPGGAMAVPGGDEIVPALNQLIAAAKQHGSVIAASRDWHPPDHISFQPRGGPWPPHCVRDSPGAALHPELDLPPDTLLVTKGQASDYDQYSAFEKTGLGAELRQRSITRVWVGGLALEVCVRASVLDAIDQGFQTHLLTFATRAVEPDEGHAAIEAMRRAGAHTAPDPSSHD